MKEQNSQILTKKIVALVGLMGVGKTTLANKLANKLGYYFIDCDQEIEDREGKTVNEIFVQNGEKYFRQIEKKVIQEIVAREEEIVIALGGGAFIDDENRKILKERTITVWIYASIEAILHRIGNKNNRPLLNRKDKRKTLEGLALTRYPKYAEADLKVDSTQENHDILIKKIIKKLSLNEK